MNIINIQGFLSLHYSGEACDILYVHTIEEPLAEFLDYNISNKRVTVRYWISKEQKNKEQVHSEFQEELEGIAKCEWGHNYSEYTGYLWTDEECKIGGHDLINELKSYAGKYLNLEIKELLTQEE